MVMASHNGSQAAEQIEMKSLTYCLDFRVVQMEFRCIIHDLNIDHVNAYNSSIACLQEAIAVLLSVYMC